MTDKDKNCTCPPLTSSVPSTCKVHCHCMENGVSKYDPRIDGECRRCGNYPRDYNAAIKQSVSAAHDKRCHDSGCPAIGCHLYHGCMSSAFTEGMEYGIASLRHEIAALKFSVASLSDAVVGYDAEIDRLKAALRKYEHCRHAEIDCVCTKEAREALKGQP